MANADRCIHCGEIVPEGRMACPSCEAAGKARRIRIKARIVAQPCMFRGKCYAACEWCDTHDYSEACVPMLQARIDLLQQIAEAWLEMTKEQNAPREAKKEEAQRDGSLYTLEEIAEAICDSTANCSEACPGWNYTCRKGNKGTLQWLQEVMNK